jgi:hypothetical protein
MTEDHSREGEMTEPADGAGGAPKPDEPAPGDLAAGGGATDGGDEPGSESEDVPSPEEAPDLDHRILCSDGGCIGVIGPDGRCKVCGLPMNPADTPPRGADAPPSPDARAEAEPDAPPEDGEVQAGPNDAPLDLESRLLCSDGACIGVIGPDRHCKVCGKPYTGEPE